MTLSKTAVLLQQEQIFLLAARTQPAKGHHHTQLHRKKFLVVLIGIDFVLSDSYYECE